MEINMSDNTDQNPNKLTRWQEPKSKPTGNSLRIGIEDMSKSLREYTSIGTWLMSEAKSILT